jgi:hypothetical protein
MDALRFDTLTRLLTRTGSRRRALLAALGGALGTTLVAFSVEEAAAKKTCPPCRKRNKQGRCRKKKSDGTKCPDGTCENGRCVATAAPPTCRGLDSPCTADVQCCSGICDSYFDECSDVRFGCDPTVTGQCPDQGICCTTFSSDGEFVCSPDPLNNPRGCGTTCGNLPNCTSGGGGNNSAQCQNGVCCCPAGTTGCTHPVECIP